MAAPRIVLRHSALALALALAASLPPAPAGAAGSAVPQMLERYRQQGAGPFDPARGERLWHREVMGPKGKPRSCTTCHGQDLRRPGKHQRTGKRIEPMDPRVNPERFTQAKKIKKWLRRNCKWTWGRECTPQEKGDLLLFLDPRVKEGS